MASAQPLELPAQLTVSGYDDPTIERLGYGPDDPYIVQVWLSCAGPSTVVMWQRLCRLVSAGQEPVVLDTADLLACTGLGSGLGRNSLGARTIARMIVFDFARRAGANLAVRRALPRMPEYRAARLPVSALRYHQGVATPPASGRFGLGKLHVSPSALAAMSRTRTDPAVLLGRHLSGDWGDVSVGGALANNEALTGVGVLASIYDLDEATTVWVLTDEGRSTTTISTPTGR